MLRFLVFSATGWLAVLAVGVETAVPYIIRGATPQVSAVNATMRRPSLQSRMWPHYWLGYALVALVLAHTSFIMGPAMGRADAVGIWAAWLALLLLFMQVALGLLLKNGSPNQRQLRRWHFWSMTALAGLILIHLLRNA
jgi:hypothetical protein